MKTQQSAGDNCGACMAMAILIGFCGLVLRDLVRWMNNAALFFQRPDALARIIEFFQALGICLGVAILLVIILIIIPSAWIDRLTGGNGGGSDDDYY